MQEVERWPASHRVLMVLRVSGPMSARDLHEALPLVNVDQDVLCPLLGLLEDAGLVRRDSEARLWMASGEGWPCEGWGLRHPMSGRRM